MFKKNKKKKVLSAVLAGMMTLSSIGLSAFTASATTGKDYYRIKTNGTSYQLTTDNLSALRSNVSSAFTSGTIPAKYNYFVGTTPKTTVSVNMSPTINKSSAGIDLGSYKASDSNANKAYNKWWKLDSSMKGKLTATYSHCGHFLDNNNKLTEIDIKLTIMDWEFLDNNYSRAGTIKDLTDDAKNSYVSFPGKGIITGNTYNRLGVDVRYCSWIKVKYSFVKSGTNTAVTVNGCTTFNDIDGGQGVHFQKNGYDGIYINGSGTELRAAKVDGSPYIFNYDFFDDEKYTLADRESFNANYWITSTFSGSSVDYVFTFGTNNVLTDPNYNGYNTKMSAEAVEKWKELCGDYVVGGGGWIINYDDKVVRSELSKPVKTVTDKDESDVISNTLSNRSEMFTYKITHYVPLETTDANRKYYSAYTLIDAISGDLNVKGVNVIKENGSLVTDLFDITQSERSDGKTLVQARLKSGQYKNDSFYDHYYTLIINVKIKDSVDISNNYKVDNKASYISSGGAMYDTNTVTTKVVPQEPYIQKHIGSDTNSTTTDYTVAVKGEDVCFSGYAYPGDAKPYESLSIVDKLDKGLKFSRLVIVDTQTSKPVTDYGKTTYDEKTNTVTFDFDKAHLADVFGHKLFYYLYVTVDSSFNDAQGSENKKMPNTIDMIINGKPVHSDEVRLWRTGVNPPVKSINKSLINEKTETVTYTISNVVDPVESEYQYYKSYAIKDELEGILKIGNIKILNENNQDVSNLFAVNFSDQTLTVTAKNTETNSFYGHTYNIVFEASIKDLNTDISDYCDENGLAYIPNTSTLTVDKIEYPSNVVYFSYQTKANSIDKYILTDNGEKVTEAVLENGSITYTGNATVQNISNVKSVVITDLLDKNLKYTGMTISLDGKNITDWGEASYDEVTNEVKYIFKPEKAELLAGKTLSYQLNCDYVGVYSDESVDIPNTIELIVNEKPTESNKVNLTTPIKYPKLSVSKLADKTTGVKLKNGRCDGKKVSGTYKPGEKIKYTITVSNTGNADALDIIVNDTMSKELKAVLDKDSITFTKLSGSIKSKKGAKINITSKSNTKLVLDKLPAGDSVELTLTAEVQSDLNQSASDLNNKVEITGKYNNGQEIVPIAVTKLMIDNDKINVKPEKPVIPSDNTPYMPNTGTKALGFIAIIGLLASIGFVVYSKVKRRKGIKG